MEPSPPPLDLAEVVMSDHCRLRIPSQPEWITRAVDFLIQRATQCGAVHSGRANRLLIALHEALTNSIIHGNLGVSSELKERGDHVFAEEVAARCADPKFASRTVDVQASFDGRAARWVLVDQGRGFDVARAMYRVENEEPDPLQPSGRGLFLIRAFVDEMCYEDQGRRLTLILRHGSGVEKRAHQRYPMGREVHIAPIDGAGQVHWEASHPAVARDISFQGIGFLQSHLAECSRVLITIPTADEPISLPAEVCRWQKVGDQVEVGCRFETTASPPALPDDHGAEPAGDSVRELVEQLAEQRPLAERRVAPRLPYSESISVELMGQPVLRGFARDLSRSGICFFTTTSLPLEVVRLSLPPGDNLPAITIGAQVVRCTRVTDGFYDVAARFLPV